MDNFEITFELEENSEIDATFELDEQKEFDCLFEVNTSGTIDHNKLINRDMANQHPISAITELENELTELHQTDSDNYNTLDTKIDDTKADLQQDLTSLSSTVQSNYTTLNNKIDTVNQELTSDIDNLAEDVARDVLELQQNINTEATTRAENDTLLQNNINTLTDDVSSKYDTLSGLITNEISNRTQADDNLQVQINAKQPQGDYATNNRVNEVAQDVALNKNQIEVAFETITSDKAELQANIDTVDDRVDVNEANITTLTNTKADKSEIPSIPVNISAFNNDVGYITDTYHDVTKQDVIEDLGTIRVNAQIGAGLSTQVGDNTSNIAYLDEKVREIELFKFPNAVIIGELNISNGQVSGFSTSNYMQFPFILDLHDQAFQIDFCFTTATNVTTQQNILDSNFGLALAIQNSKGVMAISSNGTSWNIGSSTGSITIQPNTTYYARLTWNKLQYKTALSTDGVNYTEDMVLVGATRPYPRTIFIGGCDSIETGHTPHPFLGSINMNKASLTVMGNLIWQGMDDAGLATRADISLSNLDSLGEARFTAKQDLITDLNTIRTNANLVSTKQDKLTAGENITIENNVISASGGLSEVSWGGITGTLSNQTDLKTALDNKQDVINDLDLIRLNAGQVPDLQMNKQDKISDLSTIRSNASNGASAYTTIQGYGDIVTHNAIEFALKSEIPDVSKYALDSGVVHKAGVENISGVKTFTGGSGGNNVAIKAPNGMSIGSTTQTAYAQYATIRLVNDKVNTGSYYIDGNGSVLFRHKTGTKTAEGSANDVMFTMNPETGIKAGWSGTAGVGITDSDLHDVLIDTIEYSRLNTTSKDIIGAINELNSKPSAPDLDNVTISKNSNNELQAIGVIDNNNNSIKTWTGTQEEYEALKPKMYYCFTEYYDSVEKYYTLNPIENIQVGDVIYDENFEPTPLVVSRVVIINNAINTQNSISSQMDIGPIEGPIEGPDESVGPTLTRRPAYDTTTENQIDNNTLYNVYNVGLYLGDINISANKVDINSKVIDGQWVKKYKDAYTSQSTGVLNKLEVDLSDYLPNDGYSYDVKVFILANKNGDCNINIGSNIFDDIWVFRTNAYARIGVNIFDIPVGPDKKLYISTSSTTILFVYLYGYRRIGTNE